MWGNLPPLVIDAGNCRLLSGKYPLVTDQNREGNKLMSITYNIPMIYIVLHIFPLWHNLKLLIRYNHLNSDYDFRKLDLSRFNLSALLFGPYKSYAHMRPSMLDHVWP